MCKHDYIRKASVDNMSNTMRVFLTALTVSLFIVGIIYFVTENYDEVTDLDNKMQIDKVVENIGGELEILILDPSFGNISSGWINGNLFAFRGEHEGKTQTIIRFSWEARDGKSYIAEVPMGDFQRIKTTEEKNPTVNFNLDFPSQIRNYELYLDNKTMNEIIEERSMYVSISMSDRQYQEFLSAVSSLAR